MPTPRLHVIANIKAKPEHLDEVRGVLAGFLEPTRKEAGCFVYDLLQSDANPAHFTFVEEWSDRAALDAHGRSAHITQGRAKLAGLTEGATEILTYARLL